MDSKAKEHLLPQTRIEELESMRGLAALLVVLFHAPGWNSGKEFIPFIANGYLMVDVFFVLSGFVIFKAYANTIRCAHDLWRFQFLREGSRETYSEKSRDFGDVSRAPKKSVMFLDRLADHSTKQKSSQNADKSHHHDEE